MVIKKISCESGGLLPKSFDMYNMFLSKKCAEVILECM